jgi:hypothetical protein
VTDLARAKQWPNSPANAGHRRDFYRLSNPNFDSFVVEKALSRIEDTIAPILRSLDQELREPNEEELEGLVRFMATQWVRVPAFRATVLAIADSFHSSQLSIALKSRESWAAALNDIGASSDSPGADYDTMREFQSSGQYSLSAETEWYLQRGLAAVETIIPLLRARHWWTFFSKSGSFIGSDNPVALSGPKGVTIGFKNAEVVTYPVSRHVLLYGTSVAARHPFVNRKYIARVNTLTMLTAEEQVYSYEPDFCWLDETHKYQTNWTMFSKDKFQ